jgi:hypothetical protein
MINTCRSFPDQKRSVVAPSTSVWKKRTGSYERYRFQNRLRKKQRNQNEQHKNSFVQTPFQVGIHLNKSLSRTSEKIKIFESENVLQHRIKKHRTKMQDLSICLHLRYLPTSKKNFGIWRLSKFKKLLYFCPKNDKNQQYFNWPLLFRWGYLCKEAMTTQKSIQYRLTKRTPRLKLIYTYFVWVEKGDQ